MITKAFITKVPDKDRNKFSVRIPLLEETGNKLSINHEYLATLSNTPGNTRGYKVGDAVFIGFEDNSFSSPVILGQLFLSKKYETTAFEYLNSLEVTESAILPGNTTIGGLNFTDLIRSINASKNVLANLSQLNPDGRLQIYDDLTVKDVTKHYYNDLWISFTDPTDEVKVYIYQDDEWKLLNIGLGGSVWSLGTAVKGISENTAVAVVDIPEKLHVGDMYLNTETKSLYQCTEVFPTYYMFKFLTTFSNESEKLFLRYSKNSNGNPSTPTWEKDQGFMGVYHGVVDPTDDYTKYEWIRFNGYDFELHTNWKDTLKYTLEDHKTTSGDKGITGLEVTIPQDIYFGYICELNLIYDGNGDQKIIFKNNSNYTLKIMHYGTLTDDLFFIYNHNLSLYFYCDGLYLYCYANFIYKGTNLEV